MALPPVSREVSINTRRLSLTRNSSTTSQPNVFSDDFALSSPSTMGNVTPVESIQESIDLSLADRENTSTDHTRTIPVSGLPPPALRSSTVATHSASSDNAPTAHRNAHSLALSDVGTTRSFSTSSRFSVPRPHSPYNGPTAPSQPYAMYPQVTRASSIASESTFRPVERPFVPQGGPEHPYAMYQNTVPEEDDDHSSAPTLAVPYAGAASSVRGSRSSGNDTGDIVGTDGHVESLPPYTRYADNVLAKGDMADIERPRADLSESALTPTDPPSSSSDTALSPAGAEAVADAEARKEGWREKAKKRKCCGVPCWMVLAVFTVIFISAAVGGIIGGIIGNKQGTKRAEAAASSSIAALWLDTVPVATDSDTPACPTGHYTMYLNQSEQVQQCVIDSDLQSINTWDCMDIAALGVSVFHSVENQSYNAVFDDYSLRPTLFRYGPQPPDFNGSMFKLNPVKDKYDGQWGVAMFFGTLFDKIVILEEDQLDPGMVEKGSISMSKLRRRQDYTQFKYLAIGDNPWYCYWNQTIEEFWIFLEQESDDRPTSVAQDVSMVTSAPTQPSGMPSGTPSTPSEATAAATSPSSVNIADSAPTPLWDPPKHKRYQDLTFPATSLGPGMPNLVKMVEKRKPHSNVQPYCQQMTVKPNWQIIPKENVPTICIDELQFADEPTTIDKRWEDRFARRGDDVSAQLESLCICEWMSS